MHRDDIFEALNEQVKQGVKVEIFTLPYDSINPDTRRNVESKFKELERNGATIYFDKWNVGDPSRTTTALGRWYSFHGKFMVTDKRATVLSANFTQGEELDAIVIFSSANERIKEFNEKFEQLLELFTKKDDSHDGKIHRKIIDVLKDVDASVFQTPKNIDPIHRDHWIRHYPAQICPSDSPILERLYITPFDCRGRDLIERIISEAKEYAFVSTESFTDEDFSNFLICTSVNKRIDIKILSGTESMDFTDRLDRMFKDLLAQEIGVRATEQGLHAKLVITDKALAVSSINLNRMNLGFHQTSKFWRENTETILVSRNPEIIECAKEKYLEIFNQSIDVSQELSEKLEKIVWGIFKGAFQLQPNHEVRSLFANFILKKQVDVRKLVMKIGAITKKLMQYYHRTKVEKQDFVSALVLYELSEKKQEFAQLKEKIYVVTQDIDPALILTQLEFAGLVRKEDDFYKINVEALIP